MEKLANEFERVKSVSDGKSKEVNILTRNLILCLSLLYIKYQNFNQIQKKIEEIQNLESHLSHNQKCLEEMTDFLNEERAKHAAETANYEKEIERLETNNHELFENVRNFYFSESQVKRKVTI